MKKTMTAALAGAALALSTAGWAGATDSPAGTWKTIDDETGKPASIVQITDNNGVLTGKVEKVIKEGTDPNEKCDKCQGDKKGKPVAGMTILEGFKRGDDGTYSGGTVLDPHNGKTYSGKITVIDNGQKLSLRGYVGISLIGRSQTWIRQE